MTPPIIDVTHAREIPRLDEHGAVIAWHPIQGTRAECEAKLAALPWMDYGRAYYHVGQQVLWIAAAAEHGRGA